MASISTVVLGLATVVFLVLWLTLRTRARMQGDELRRLNAVGLETAATLERLRADAARDRDERIKAETERESLRGQVNALRVEVVDAQRERAAANESRAAGERAAALAEQELAQMRATLTDWNKTKVELLTSAKAAVLETSTELSSKLLADHKQETEAARQAARRETAETTRVLSEQFERIVQSVAVLDGNVNRSGKIVETVVRALSSPGGAGAFAEIGLENTLKSFGLEPGRDFVMQFAAGSMGSAQLRPDAVVFLPGDQVMIIDSKASKFVLDVAEAEGTEGEAEAYRNLANTMRGHLKSLAGKDYRGAVIDACRRAARTIEIGHAVTVMCLPSEAALERLNRADPTFIRSAAQSHITLSGPIGLQGLIGVARIQIDLGQQAANQREIVEAASRLLDAIGDALRHVDKANRGLHAAANGFAAFIGSVNRNLLPKARSLVKLGVRPGKKAELPNNVPRFQVSMFEDDVVEGEATEVLAVAPPVAGKSDTTPDA